MDIQYITQLENDYHRSKIHYSLHQLLLIFPEAGRLIKRKAKEDLQRLKFQRDEIVKVERQYRKITTTIYKDRWFFEEVVNQLYVPSLVASREEVKKKIKETLFLLSILKPTKPKNVKDDKITPEDIMRAKQVPVSNFLKINRAGFSQCQLHTDKTPSVKIYEKQNKWYCFSCHQGGDCIDLIMKLHSKDFHAAIRFLINK